MAGNFYAVECPDCENEQIVFDKASSEVACAVCGHTLARPTGGKADIDGEIVETVERRSADAGDTVEAR
ncbi:30S ribosomal protein S27e [Halalkalicoccus sp. NIPERK01]|uniref:30S ribosomal protein S27e n=1 Tax=Halalkalicoccus sp. NIPERK01 TaxID=3053469 RepID=UPI00256F2F60|nr:30S ribosomal protein S27e [Halalkalicoccus sp. NIPERK01]MDL5363764.1 30S ribosomal protein S27e [Halalkalicoccus sp. NIPERK01]